MVMVATFLAMVTVGAQDAKPPRDVIAFVTDRDANRDCQVLHFSSLRARSRTILQPRFPGGIAGATR